MQRDREPVAGFLRVEEAEMLCELLESAGIDSRVEGAVASCLAPALPGIGGGARLVVRRADAARARELIATSGLFRGEGGAAAEIPEHEWASRGPEGAPAPVSATSSIGRKTFLFYPLVVVAAVAAATVLRLLAGR